MPLQLVSFLPPDVPWPRRRQGRRIARASERKSDGNWGLTPGSDPRQNCHANSARGYPKLPAERRRWRSRDCATVVWRRCALNPVRILFSLTALLGAFLLFLV